MPVPDFSPGEVLTAAAMDSIGLWKIAETSFTTAATPFIDGCFSADYEHYVALFRFTSSTTGGYTNLQLRAATVAKATNYNRSGFLYNTAGTTSTDSAGTGQNGFRLAFQSTTGLYAKAEFFRPFSTAETGFISLSNNAGSSINYSGIQTESYSADGFQVIASGNAATYTGTMRVYGYRN
jgi:hypothetical protein